MAESSSSQPISIRIRPQYDVFVSFRGKDVRNNFVSHLQAALKRKGITTFSDEDRLKRGEEISPALVEAIQRSSISIVVFSQNYASSKWCLEELSKIVECRDMDGQMVMPVFYHVHPSHVRKQKRSYEEAFRNHEETLQHKKDDLQRWRDALKQIANLSGFHSANWRLESQMIDKIIQEILKKLDRLTLDDVDGLVGIEKRVERIESSLCTDSNDVRILGIWGMGGIGKTTVTRTLFHKIKNQFDGCCFLENIRENSGKNGHGLPDLRRKLLSQVMEEVHIPMDISREFLKKRMCGKKVLIILDDIDHMEQLENLAGRHNWFGVGSRIVITTRNRQLLTEVDEVYDYAKEQLTYEEALLLFSHHAFNSSHPTEAYLELSKKAINYACGNPLALKILGSCLRKKDEKTWESALARLERFSNDEIVKRVLEISFEGLDWSEKNILLDVACFFKGEDLKFATSIWNVCGFFPDYGVSILRDKCLISLRCNSQLWMHDLIQEMCKAIVIKENIEPSERSRLWKPQDIFHIFNKNIGTSKIQCIILNLSETNEVLELRDDAFVKMENLRLLKFFSSELNESLKIRLPRGLTMLPDSLRYLFWDGYPNKFLPSKFNAQNLLGLSLRQSCINQLWKEHWMFKHSSICLKHLKRLDLSGCPNFSNFSAICDNMEHLYELSLEGTSASNMPSSIGNLTELLSLNLSYCKELVSLPDSICNLKRLERLNLNGCESLQHLPENIGNLESLWWLWADGTSIKNVPSSIICLKKIRTLSFSGCRGIKRSTSHWMSWILDRSNNHTTSFMGLQLPPLGGIQKLKVLSLNNCNLLELPVLDNLPSLESLGLRRNNFENLPQTIFCNLSSLKYLKLSYCRRLRSLPELPPSLRLLKADECTSLESFMSSVTLYRGIGRWNAKMYQFGNCLKLKDQCNNILESMIKGIHLSEGIVQNLYDQGSCCRDGLNFSLWVAFPGSEIPEWFSNQAVGKAATLHLPPRCLDKSLGFALCFILSPNGTFQSFCNIGFELIFRDYGENTSTRYYRSMGKVYGEFSLKEDHVFFGFASLCRSHWPNHISLFKCSKHIECSIRVYAYFYDANDSVTGTVNKCGVRLVNMEDTTQPTSGS